MSDERELVERLATIEATPRARWVAELRADLDAAWETEDPGYLDSLRTTTVTLVDNEPTPSEPSSGHRWATLIAAAAAVVLVVGVARRLRPRRRGASRSAGPDRHRAPDAAAACAVRHTTDEQLAPGTYFVDEVDGTPTPRIFVTIGTGWTNFVDGSALDKRGPGEPSPRLLRTTSASSRSADPTRCTWTPATWTMGSTRGLWTTARRPRRRAQ